MNSLLTRLAVNSVRGWTWLYTWRMPPASRERRRAEIESDLWEFQCAATGDQSVGSALHILLRLLIGLPDDLAWRAEQASVAAALTQGSVALSARIAGAALLICALWVIDADASRKRLPVAGAQSPPIAASGPAFEAASVKPNKSGDPGVMLVPQQSGRLSGTNVTAAMLIRFAYDLPDFQVFGGPNWLNADRFDLVAKAEGDPPLEQKRLMLRRLMSERFKLTAHTETRELPTYALVMARSDGRMGPHLHRSEVDCVRADQPSSDSGIGPSPPGGPAPCGFFGFAPGTSFPSGRGGLAFRGLTMASLAKNFVPILHRSVIDKTGLTGSFDDDCPDRCWAWHI